MLNHNFLTRWIHKRRYDYALRYVSTIAKRNKGRPLRIIDIGCANARLYDVLKDKFDILYRGIEIDNNFVNEATFRNFSDPHFSIGHGSATNAELFDAFDGLRPDLVFCFETLEHMNFSDANRVLSIVQRLQPSMFLISIPVETGLPVLIKNVLSWMLRYHRHKNYTWRETLQAAFGRKSLEHRGCHKGFNWRRIDIQLRLLFGDVKYTGVPCKYLPWWLSNSLFYIGAN